MRAGRLALVGTLALAAAGCGGGGGGKPAGQTQLTGAGSTLVYPLVSAWQQEYEQRAGVVVTYSPVGSGAGIVNITKRTVDFGASDAPLTPDQEAAANGVVQVPWALAATLFSYNVPGVPNKVKLSGPVIADIFLGRITRWNDPAVARLNPNLSLPPTKIVPVFRTDGSGDTYAVTDYLAKVSPDWKRRVGVGTQVSFPVGVGGSGNAGVAGAISRTDGAIGYLAISYVHENHLDYALVENAAGKFPLPGIPSISAAASVVRDLPPDNAVSITDPPASAADAYPVSTFTYALVPEQSDRAKALRGFLDYAITDGQRLGAKYQFAPLPQVVLDADRAALSKLHG